MKLVDAIADALAQPDVTEFAVAAGRVPCVMRGGSLRAVGLPAPTHDDLRELLGALGIQGHARQLSDQPVVVRAHCAALGDLLVHLMRREDTLQLRVSRAGGQAAQPAPKHAPSRLPDLQRPRAIETSSPARAAVARSTGGSPQSLELASPQSLELASAQSLELAAPAASELASALPSARASAKSLELAAPQAFELASPGRSEHDLAPPSSLEASSPVGSKLELASAKLLDLASPARPELELRTPTSAAPHTAERSALHSASPVGSALELASPACSDRRGHAVAEQGPADRLLHLAREKGATDMHVIAGRPTLLRLAGELVAVGEHLSPEAVEAMWKPLVPERLASTLSDEGSCDFALAHPDYGRFRVNVSRQRTGLKASVRLIPRQVPTLESLGLPLAIADALVHHQGLIVLTGPTGHGKSSTLAALVDRLNVETTRHVICVEDPVEHLHLRKRALITQREVGTHTRSFASALKASLREDPDVIVVGELRDTETVRMALAASETGHLVLGTMNTPSAAKTIDRLIDLFPPGDQPQVRMTLAGGLRLVVSQRLLRSADGTRVFAAVEMLPGNVALWNLIREGKTYQIPSLQQRGKGLGIVRLDDSLANLVRAGSVVIDEACAMADAPDELRARLADPKGAP